MTRAATTIAVGIAAAFACAAAQAADIKIGTIYDYTGPFAGGGSKAAGIGNKIAIDMINERGGRAQLARAKGGERPAGLLDRALDLGKARRQRGGPPEADAHDLEPRLRGDAARILKDRRDIAIAASREGRGCHVGRLSLAVKRSARNRGTLRQAPAIDKPV